MFVSLCVHFYVVPITSQTVLYVQAVTTPDNDTELISSFKVSFSGSMGFIN